MGLFVLHHHHHHFRLLKADRTQLIQYIQQTPISNVLFFKRINLLIDWLIKSALSISTVRIASSVHNVLGIEQLQF